MAVSSGESRQCLSLAGPEGSLRFEFTGDWMPHELEGAAVIDCAITLSYRAGSCSCTVAERLADDDVRQLALALSRCGSNADAKPADRFAWEPFDADITILFSVYGTAVSLAADLGADSGRLADIRASVSVIDVSRADAREGARVLNRVLAGLPDRNRA